MAFVLTQLACVQVLFRMPTPDEGGQLPQSAHEPSQQHQQGEEPHQTPQEVQGQHAQEQQNEQHPQQQ